MSYDLLALSVIRGDLIKLLSSLNLIVGYDYGISPPNKKAVFVVSFGIKVENNFKFIEKKIAEKFDRLIVLKNLSSGKISIDVSRMFKGDQNLIEKTETAKFCQNMTDILRLFPTQRELEVMQYVCEGLSSKEIAAIQYVSLKTVDVHRYNIFRKFNLKNSIDLVKFALRNGYYSLHEMA